MDDDISSGKKGFSPVSRNLTSLTKTMEMRVGGDNGLPIWLFALVLFIFFLLISSFSGPSGSERDELIADISALEKRESALSSDVQRLEGTLRDTSHALSTAEKSLAKVTGRLATADDDHAKRMAALNGKHDTRMGDLEKAHSARMTELKAAHEARKGELAEALKAQEEKLAANKAKLGRLDDFDGEIADLVKRRDALTAMLTQVAPTEENGVFVTEWTETNSLAKLTRRIYTSHGEVCYLGTYKNPQTRRCIDFTELSPQVAAQLAKMSADTMLMNPLMVNTGDKNPKSTHGYRRLIIDWTTGLAINYQGDSDNPDSAFHIKRIDQLPQVTQDRLYELLGAATAALPKGTGG